MGSIGRKQMIADIEAMMTYLKTSSIREAYKMMLTELRKLPELEHQYQSKRKSSALELEAKQAKQLNQFFK
jgi:hypothetical protein